MTRPTSLRQRLVLGAVATGVIFACVFGGVAAWTIEHTGNQALQTALESRLELARDEVSANGTISRDAGSPKTDLVQIVDARGVVRASSPALAGIGPLVDVGTVTAVPSRDVQFVALNSPDIDLAVLAVPYPLPHHDDSPAGMGALVVATDAEGFTALTVQLLALLVAGLLGVILIIGILSWILTGRALTSVTTLTEQAERTRPGDLDTGLPIPARDAELARMVGALNRMIGRLNASHTTELAFAADAGHRLRTPVATLRAEAELALGENDPLELTAALGRIIGDADHLTLIVDRMLARARQPTHPPEPVLESLRGNLPRWTRQAAVIDVTLSLTTNRQIGQDLRCRELVSILDPLIDNAIRHTPATDHIELTATTIGPAEILQVDVTNTGAPVSPALQTNLFDAWVSSRDASKAGGLGLWLARETARDLGGDVHYLERQEPTTFRVTLPPARLGPLP